MFKRKQNNLPRYLHSTLVQREVAIQSHQQKTFAFVELCSSTQDPS